MTTQSVEAIVDRLTEAERQLVIEDAIDRMGWPEIHAFQYQLRRGQDIYEDAGGFMLRAIKALFGIKRDAVTTYREAAREMVRAHLLETGAAPAVSDAGEAR